MDLARLRFKLWRLIYDAVFSTKVQLLGGVLWFLEACELGRIVVQVGCSHQHEHRWRAWRWRSPGHHAQPTANRSEIWQVKHRQGQQVLGRQWAFPWLSSGNLLPEAFKVGDAHSRPRVPLLVHMAGTFQLAPALDQSWEQQLVPRHACFRKTGGCGARW